MTEILTKQPTPPREIINLLDGRNVSWGSDSIDLGEWEFDLAGLHLKKAHVRGMPLTKWAMDNGNLRYKREGSIGNVLIGSGRPDLMFSDATQQWVLVSSENTSKFVTKFYLDHPQAKLEWLECYKDMLKEALQSNPQLFRKCKRLVDWLTEA